VLEKSSLLVCHYRNTLRVLYHQTHFCSPHAVQKPFEPKTTKTNSFSSCTESEAIDRLNESTRVGVDEDEEEKVAGSDELDTTPLAPGSVEYDENNSVGEEGVAVKDECRGDDKFRCGTTSTYICEVEKCDGVSNCPNGEDEENCPGSATIEGSGEEIDVNHDDQEEPAVDQTSFEPEIEPIGDFL
jgi:hypothetical protein